MEPKFTIQYGEYAVAQYLSKIKGASIFIPLSAQEKGIDLLIYKFINGNNKVQTVQVKMSGSYNIDKKYQNRLWFNRFEVQDNADWFILVGIYPQFSSKYESKVSDIAKWDEIMLVFTKDEMKQFMSELKQKKTPDKPDTKFYFGFNDKTKIFRTRGYPQERDMSEYLIEKRLIDIEKALEGEN